MKFQIIKNDGDTFKYVVTDCETEGEAIFVLKGLERKQGKHFEIQKVE